MGLKFNPLIFSGFDSSGTTPAPPDLSSYLKRDGTNTIIGTILPDVDQAHSLGGTNQRFAAIYTGAVGNDDGPLNLVSVGTGSTVSIFSDNTVEIQANSNLFLSPAGSGRVGIKTAAPIGTLDVRIAPGSGSGVYFATGATGGDHAIAFESNGTYINLQGTNGSLSGALPLGLNTGGGDINAGGRLTVNAPGQVALQAFHSGSVSESYFGRGASANESFVITHWPDATTPYTDLHLWGSTTNHVTLTNNGRVGIGTNTPNSVLEIQKGLPGYDGLTITMPYACQIILNNTDNNNGANDRRNWGFFTETDVAGGFNLKVGTSQNAYPSTIVQSWDKTGKVGIGTISPNEMLEVNGAISASGTAAVAFGTSTTMDYDNTGDSGRLIVRGPDNSTRAGFKLIQEAANGSMSINNFVVDSSGRVGIGTTPPAHNLHVSGSGNVYSMVESTGGGGSVIRLKTPLSEYGWYALNGVNKFSLYDYTANADRITVDSVGNVGIGTTTPDRNLTVSSSEPTILLHNNAASADNNKWQFLASGESLYLQTLNDALAGNTIMKVDRTGLTVDTVEFPQGLIKASESLAVGSGTFNAGNGPLQVFATGSNSNVFSLIGPAGEGSFSMGTLNAAFGNGTFIQSSDLTTVTPLYLQRQGGGVRLGAAGSTGHLWPDTDGTSGQFLSTNGSGVLSWASAAAAGANTSLSNLTATSINQALLPATDNTLSLGDSTKRWGSSFIAGQSSWGVPNSETVVVGRSLSRPSGGGGAQAGMYTQVGAGYGMPLVLYTDSDATNNDVGYLALETGNITSSASIKNTGAISIKTGNNAGTAAGASGSITLTTGTVVGGARGNISLSADSIQLSANIIPTAQSTYSLGTSASNRFANLHVGTVNSYSSIGLYTSGSTLKAQLLETTAIPSGITADGVFRTPSAGQSLAVHTGDGTASGALHLETGNASTGQSGNIVLQTGTAVGQRGSINLNARNVVFGSSAPIASDILPFASETYNLGSSSSRWTTFHGTSVALYSASSTNTGNLTGFGTTPVSAVSTAALVNNIASPIALYTGNRTSGSGSVYIESGNNTGTGNAAAGNINITAGGQTNAGGVGVGGSVAIATGNVAGSGNGGEITLSTGTVSGGTRGKISFDARVVDHNKVTSTNFVVENGVTGSRPASPVVGQCYFDTTLVKPIWYSGTNWVDATGTTV